MIPVPPGVSTFHQDFDMVIIDLTTTCTGKGTHVDSSLLVFLSKG
jgi:hypothetical protein